MERRVEVKINLSLDEAERRGFNLEIRSDGEVEVSMKKKIQAVGTNGHLTNMSASSSFYVRVGTKESADSEVADTVNLNSTQAGLPGIWAQIKAVKLAELGAKLFAEAVVKVLFKFCLQYILWPFLKFVLVPLLAAGAIWLASHDRTSTAPALEYENTSPTIQVGLSFFALIAVWLLLKSSRCFDRGSQSTC